MQEHQAFFDSLAGERIAGRYVVERLLGSGGMGIVVAARYAELDQTVAIKFLRAEHAANSTLSARFLREARLAGKVKSPHFVRVFDVGKLDRGIPYMVMEFLEGRELGEELDKNPSLPVGETLDYVMQALVGVAEIHGLGIVHRDLKPSNLFLSNAAGARIVKVLDFGISKENPISKDAPLTATDNMMGTPQFMSPEQVKESRSVDARSDIWSIGVILYDALTGQLPFVAEGGSVGEVLGMILFTDPRPIKELRPDLPEGLSDVVMRCLRRSPDDRYPDVAALADALGPFLPVRSQHRVSAVRQALGHGQTVAATGSGQTSALHVATNRETPEARRAAEDVTHPAPVLDALLVPAPSAPQVTPNFVPAPVGTPTPRAEARRPPVTVLTSTQASVSDANVTRSGLNGRRIAVIAALGLAGVGAAALLARGGRAPDEVTPAASAPEAVTPPVTAEPTPLPSATSPATSAATVAPDAAPRVAAPVSSPRPPARPPTNTARPPPTTSPSGFQLDQLERR